MGNIKDIANDLDNYTISNSMLCNTDQAKVYFDSKSENLNIFSQNIRSIMCNISQLEILLTQLKLQFDIIILSECWLKNSYGIPELNGYSYFCSTAHKTQNEGVVVYTKKYLKALIYEHNLDDANCLIIKLNTDTVIIAVYRPPTYCIKKFLESTDNLLTIFSPFKNIIFIGDININIKKCDNEPRAHDYLNLMASHGLLPAHLLATRNQNCLDHIMIKTVLNSNVLVITTTITDHYTVCLSLGKKLLEYSNKHPKMYINYPEVISELEKSDFTPIYKCADVDNALKLLTNIITTAINNNSTFRKQSHRQKIIKPWITPGLLRCIRHRDKLHLKAKKNPDNSEIKQIYIRYRNFCKTIIHKVKCAYENSEFQKAKHNSKKTWKLIKEIAHINKQKDNNEILLDIDQNPQNSINIVNNHFASVGKNLAENIKPVNSDIIAAVNKLSQQSTNSFALLDTDDKEILSIIMNLKDDCAVGYDGISNRLLKMAHHVLTPVITYICNISFHSGIFPKHFKTAVIIPVFKSGNRDSVNNYRPISILPAMSKILEKLLNKRLVKYLKSFELLSENQYGFTQGKSTEDALRSFTETVVMSLDNKLKCLGVFLDLAKAFDTVSIPHLLDKIENIGIRGKELDLFKSYLTDRTQRVKIGSYISEDAHVTYGVPQGSILGPTLFLIYINQLCNLKLLNARIFTFADDTAIVFYGRNWDEIENITNSGLKKVLCWLNINKLTVNLSKTKYITFSLTKQGIPDPFNIVAHTCENRLDSICQCTHLDRVSNIKYLGVWIDENFNWHRHIELLTNRTRKIMSIFRKLRHILDANVLKVIYYSLCQSVIIYCVSVWGGAHKSSLIRIERAQRAALKVLTSKPMLYPTVNLYKETEVLTVRKLFILKNLIYAHTKLPTNQSINKRRKDYVYKIIPHRTSFAKRHPCIAAAYNYNKLTKIVSLYKLSLYKFKKTVIKYLSELDYEETENFLCVPK